MKIQLLPSVVGEASSRLQYLSGLVVNGRVAIDAGCLGLSAPVERQRAIEHVVISHSHIDHIATLPIFLDNVYTQTDDCVSVHGSEHTIQCLRRHLFNDEVWPDFVRLSSVTHPFLCLETLAEGQILELDAIQIEPIELNHVVPTFGFIVSDDRVSVGIVSDTAPTDAIWTALEARNDLAAVFLEASFPEAQSHIADVAMHLTPSLFARERQKITADVPFIAIHLKSAHQDSLVAELESLGIAGLEIGQPGRVYEF